MRLTHHAYLVEGSAELLPALEADVRTRMGDIELFSRMIPKFGIDDARQLREQASLKGVGKPTVFVTASSSMTTESQQALLKLLEEPREGAVFIFLVPHGMFIPTLRSRTLPYPAELATKLKNPAKEFLAAAPQARSEMAGKILKREETAREEARELLNGLELELYKKISNPDARRGLEDVARFRSYLADRSPSLKMLLEHLAATLPKL